MTGPAPWLEIEQIIGRLGQAVDQVMGEGGLWDERTAARAFRQAEGDALTAADLVQKLRASLPRFGAARPVERRGPDDDRQRLAPVPGPTRHDLLPVVVDHPSTGEPVTIGQVRVTEVEVLQVVEGRVGATGPVEVGYGICLGHNERRAKAMAQLDIARRVETGLIGARPSGPDQAAGELSQQALLEQLRRPGGCGVGAASGRDG